MTLLLNCQDIGKTLGPRLLFDSVSFTVNKGDRLGIIGANGSGKTTLLRILCGLDEADGGRITLSGNTVVGYLSQEDSLADDATVAKALLEGLDGLTLDETQRYNRLHAMLSRAGFADAEIPVRALSGGWRKRLAVCRSLIREPDLLIMDEPTNHLDLEGILWLEKLVSSSFSGIPSTFVMVSHDRRFLDNTATRIIELSRLYPDGFLAVDGNYSSFLHRKELFLVQQLEQETRLANKLRRETEWLQKGPKARTTKAKFRIDAALQLQEDVGEIRARNTAQREIEIDFDATGRKTKKLLEARDLRKSFAEKTLFSHLDLILSPGVRLGLLGPNGCGKSTLMRLLATEGKSDKLLPDSGSIRVADGARIVSFAQDRHDLDLGVTLKQALAPDGDAVVYRGQSLHVVTWARKLLFRPDQLDTPVGNLSGGEQARILIAGLMHQPADILLLDEPTNDLDIPSLQVLEESLLEFPGAVVIVTHDRYLMDRVCNRVLGFTGNGRVAYFASFDQWYAALQEQKQPGKSGTQAGKKEKKKISGRLSYLDQREYDGLEERITAAEEKEQALLKEMAIPEVASDPDKAQDCWQRLESVRRKIDQLYLRWDELEAIKNSFTE